METVATGNKIALQTAGFPFAEVGDRRPVAFGVMDSHLAHAIDDRRAAGGPGSHQIAGDFGLAINHYALTVG